MTTALPLTPESITPTRMVDDHKWEDGPSNSGGNYHGNVTVREALNRSLNTVAWQILEDIGVNYGLRLSGRNGVPEAYVR